MTFPLSFVREVCARIGSLEGGSARGKREFRHLLERCAFLYGTDIWQDDLSYSIKGIPIASRKSKLRRREGRYGENKGLSSVRMSIVRERKARLSYRYQSIMDGKYMALKLNASPFLGKALGAWVGTRGKER